MNPDFMGRQVSRLLGKHPLDGVAFDPEDIRRFDGQARARDEVDQRQQCDCKGNRKGPHLLIL